MKSIHLISVFFLFLSFANSSFAQYSKNYADNNKRPQTSDSDGGSGKFSAGLASNEDLLYTSATALTGAYALNRKSIVQGYFIMPSTDPSTYGIGGAFKYATSGHRKLGFHVGGGLGIGKWNEGKSFMRIVGIVGFHFPIHKRVVMHIDAGLTIRNDDKGGSTSDKDSNMSIKGNSELFGISLLYTL